MVNNVKTSKYLKTGMSEVLLILYNNNIILLIELTLSSELLFTL